MIDPYRRQPGVYRHVFVNTISVVRGKSTYLGHPTMRPRGRITKRSPYTSCGEPNRSFETLADVTSVGKYHSREFAHVRFTLQITSTAEKSVPAGGTGGVSSSLCLGWKTLETDQNINPSRSAKNE
ncbi:Hypothetical protein CINCED_3A008780 [Cinara cedri]|uniref:Uncharacterized protein n=1 Tax=Cinara cedri TaxID=506608 RepID=A0A5E4M1X7_9HEMI|nr:Hypothetical protein CINCED_3A008780 [Cinara cedri]